MRKTNKKIIAELISLKLSGGEDVGAYLLGRPFRTIKGSEYAFYFVRETDHIVLEDVDLTCGIYYIKKSEVLMFHARTFVPLLKKMKKVIL